MAHTPPGSQQTPGTCMRQLGATTCSHNRGAMPAHNHIDRQTAQHNNMPQHRSCDQRSPHPDTHQGTDSTCNHADSSMNGSSATIQINNQTSQAPHPQLPQQSTLATKQYAPTCSHATLVTVQDAETTTATDYSSKIHTTLNPAHNVPAG